MTGSREYYIIAMMGQPAADATAPQGQSELTSRRVIGTDNAMRLLLTARHYRCKHPLKRLASIHVACRAWL